MHYIRFINKIKKLKLVKNNLIGFTHSEYPIKSYLNPAIKLLCSYYFEKNIYSNKKIEPA